MLADGDAEFAAEHEFRASGVYPGGDRRSEAAPWAACRGREPRPTYRSALDLHHDVLGLFLGVLQALVDERVGLLGQGLEIELRRAGFADQIAVQKRDRDVAVRPALAHDVHAAVLFDGPVGLALSKRRGRSDHGNEARDGGRHFRTRYFHLPSPLLSSSGYRPTRPDMQS